ncbi:MAG: SpoIID/LytB domain-containing protein, partial [Clostridiaceae bacterium]|nr:SpoIID/LytB domain-containing protein [Clostridiaceae bacterium]
MSKRKKYIKKILLFCLAFIVILYINQVEALAESNEEDSKAEITSNNESEQTLKEVRVGLFFKDSKSYNPSSDISCFTISAVKGLEVGYFINNEFNKVLDVNDNSTLTIRKDAYFIYRGSSMKEYIPNDNDPGDGKKLGPYHIQIGTSFDSYDKAKDKLNVYINDGIECYIALTDSWYIWTGFYTDLKSAENDLSNKIKESLGEEEYKIIQPSKDNIVIADEKSGNILLMFGKQDGHLQVRPGSENNPYIYNINGKSYRGSIEVRRYDTSDMTVINILPVEQYLYGVVPCEMQWTFHPEALKAQAVTARTYIYKNLGKYSVFGFDVCATVYSQVYGGYSVERETTNKAVDETRGEKLYYNGELAQVFFFSTSGGRTESSGNVWSDDLPYLQSVEDKYEDPNSRYYTWERVMTADEISRIMKEKGFDTGEIKGIRIVNTSETGRVTELVVSGTIGDRVFLKARCREIFDLPSQWYKVLTDADAIV